MLLTLLPALLVACGAEPGEREGETGAQGAVGIFGRVLAEPGAAGLAAMDSEGGALELEAFPACATLRGETEVGETPVVGPGGGVADALVRILGQPADPEAAEDPDELDPALLTVRDCELVPRLLVVSAGQRVVLRNADPTFHEIYTLPAGRGWDETDRAAERSSLVSETAGSTEELGGFDAPLPFEGVERTTRFPRAGDRVEVRCRVHPWMRSWIAVVDPRESGRWTVSEEGGGFLLDDLEPGRYPLQAWHGALGSRRVAAVAEAPAAAREGGGVEIVFEDEESR